MRYPTVTEKIADMNLMGPNLDGNIMTATATSSALPTPVFDLSDICTEVKFNAADDLETQTKIEIKKAIDRITTDAKNDIEELLKPDERNGFDVSTLPVYFESWVPNDIDLNTSGRDGSAVERVFRKEKLVKPVYSVEETKRIIQPDPVPSQPTIREGGVKQYRILQNPSRGNKNRRRTRPYKKKVDHTRARKYNNATEWDSPLVFRR